MGVVFAEMSERYLTACKSISRCSYMLVFPLTDNEKTPYFCLVAQISTGIRIKQRFVRSRLCGTYFWFFGTDVLNSQHKGSNKLFGMSKRELDSRYWLVFAIVPLRTRNREKRGDLLFLPSAACRNEPFGAFARLRFCISICTLFR